MAGQSIKAQNFQRSFTLFCAAALLALLWGGELHAQIKPRIMLVVDTSGSMAWDIDGVATYGDGSRDPWGTGRYCCPGNGGSRMEIAKDAMRQMIFAAGDIEFAMIKFPQTYAYEGGAEPPWSSWHDSNYYRNNQQPSSRDRIRYEGQVGFQDSDFDWSRPAEWLAVDFGPGGIENNPAEVLMWMDHHEFDGEQSVALNSLGTDAWEQELRADGYTPLGGQVRQARLHLETVQLDDPFAKTPSGGCRPYTVVLLSDGESFDFDPTNKSDVPNPNPDNKDWVAEMYNSLAIETYVIGLAFNSPTLENIARSGSGDARAAFQANSEEELSSILYTIISNSVLVETCDGADNNCNCPGDTNLDTVVCGPGDEGVDEGFTLYCDRQGELGPATSSTIHCTAPSEVCDGVDDNCDGQTDEGDWTLDPQWGTVCDDNSVGECQPGTFQCEKGTGWVCAGSIPPSAEICDGLDNDCDGETDEASPGVPLEAGACGSAEGECTAGTWTCMAGSFSCVGETTGGTEVCDGLDNDCDSLTDEGLTNTCGTSDVGICRMGVQFCTGGGWDTCQGNVDPAPAELCNGVDDNCDGQTDESFPEFGQTCPPGHPTQGECDAPTFECNAGQLECPVAHVYPTAEICDGLDNDCDGGTDEGLFQSCGGGTTTGNPDEGACQQGVSQCVAGAWGVCQGEVIEASEICDGLDNDCDGTTDEAFPESGQSCPPGLTDVGECQTGSYICQSGGLVCSGTQVHPVAESCDNLDNDCDGETDEGVFRPCGGGTTTGDPNEGACQEGIELCTAGSWGSCQGEVTEATQELCNDIDDDCDGTTDEDPVFGVGELCGDCLDGLTECNAGVLECVGGSSSLPEVCDGADNNCNCSGDSNGDTVVCGPGDDGVDEGVFMTCGGCDAAAVIAGWECTGDPNEGACQQGMAACIGPATYGGCQGGIAPSVELCDGIDNDCDGLTDEAIDIAQAGTQCQAAQGICEYAEWTCVLSDGGTPAMECCSGIEGDGTCTEPVSPETETCDGLDNDCDGDIDEDIPEVGLPCGAGGTLNNLGECTLGTQQCVCDTDTCTLECCETWDGSTCTPPVGPVVEDCNALDDDCDGLTDEDLFSTTVCTNSQTADPNEGICEEGVLICQGGAYDTCNANLPTDEICDGKDNDCDGETDEGMTAECPGGICIEGQCAETCGGGELSCPGGKTCVELDAQFVCIVDICSSSSPDVLPCVENDNWCDDGYEPPCHCEPVRQECVDACYGKVCAAGQECLPQAGGKCVALGQGCYADGCGAGQVCIENACVADPCDGVSCGDGEYCNGSGQCVSTCVDLECPAGQGCFEGACVEDPCAGVACEAGLSCINGECEVGACFNVECQFYEVCVDGECQENPCWNLDCPNGMQCVGGACYDPTYEPAGPPVDTDSATDVDTDDDGPITEIVDTDAGKVEGLSDILATGSGGCVCSTAVGAGSTDGPTLWPFALILALIAWRTAASRRRLVHLLAVSGALFALAGCNVDSYGFDELPSPEGWEDTSGWGSGDGDGDSDGDTDGDTDSDTQTQVCDTSYPDDDCDGFDDNCDGRTDEEVDTVSNLAHCGGCNQVCGFEHAYASCDLGVCSMGDCAILWFDNNGFDTDGCEYFCQKTADVDLCNGVDLGDTDNPYVPLDDDCDGSFDEDEGFDTDPVNCGRCRNICRFDHATASCVGGSCEMGACDANFVDQNGSDTDGCETGCIFSSDTDLCNNLDDDCDGSIDEDYTGGGGACYDTDAGGCALDTDSAWQCEGTCATGVMACDAGVERCTGQVKPAIQEVCDGLDNNCDGATDENIFASCGGNPSGDPFEGICHPGFQTCDSAASTPGNPVFTACTGSQEPLVGETCNGLDDDCDGLTDEVVDLTDPLVGQTCGQGACAGTYACVGAVVTCNGTAPGVEVACDSIDNDCDGITDIDIATTTCGGGPGPDPNEGMCRVGTTTCSGPTPICSGSVEPACLPTDGCDDCDGQDNDCDGLTDEDYVVTTCGICNDGNMNCTAGVAQCEGASDPEPEVCDGQDNDCDGSTDENLFQACDGCDADAVIAGWDCTVNPNQGSCQQGLQSCDPLASTPGTPVYTACIGAVNPVAETCSGQDDDCDGDIDADDPDLTAPGACLSCFGGVLEVCGSSGWECQYQGCGAATEGIECLDGDSGSGPPVAVETRCDGIDGDCDGQIDDDFQMDTNVLHCGSCGNDCSTLPWANVAEYYCQSGSCYIKTCSGDTVDADNDETTGCECTPSVPNDEICDGVDNDCNGLVDENAVPETCNGIDDDCDGETDEIADLVAPAGTCDAGCPGINTPFCDGVNDWKCDYDCTTDTDGGPVECSGDLPVAIETLCDGNDGNCDGQVDEAFGLGTTCDLGCYAGVERCDSGMAGSVCCDLAKQSSGAICQAGNERPDMPFPDEDPIPNGVDENCDGLTDEGLDSCVDYLNVDGGTWDFDIFIHEASRYDATDTDPGSISTVACSATSKIPWTLVDFDEATDACDLLNDPADNCTANPDQYQCWRVCSAEQWQYACEWGGASQTIYPYANSYNPTKCNGADFDTDTDTTASNDYLMASGAASDCIAEYDTDPGGGIYDLSGNAEEWTRTQRGAQYEIRGGSYNDVGPPLSDPGAESGLACTFDFWGAEPDFRMANLGFRCCRGDDPL